MYVIAHRPIATAPPAGVGSPAGVRIRSKRRRARRPQPTPPAPTRSEPRPCVHLLRTPEELATALERAAAFEARAADLVNERLDRYDLLRVAPADALAADTHPRDLIGAEWGLSAGTTDR